MSVRKSVQKTSSLASNERIFSTMLSTEQVSASTDRTRVGFAVSWSKATRFFREICHSSGS